MRRLSVGFIVVSVAALAVPSIVLGQAPPAPAAPTGQKTLAATMNVHVFPSKGQAADQQSQDEAACYTYAQQNTGTDPFALQKQAEQQAQQTEAQKQQAAHAGKQRSGAAVKGAAAGAVVGEIANDDAGKGAAVGAAAGAVAGRRRGKEASKQATAQAEQQGQQAQAATAAQMDSFKKAFSVCLEAKNYMVKF